MKLNILGILISSIYLNSYVFAIERPEFTPLNNIKAPFFEQFSNKIRSEKKWIRSLFKDNNNKNNENSYNGKWKIEEPITYPGFEKDFGLVLKSSATKAAISYKLPQDFDNSKDTLVLQYEVKTQNGLQCGGAYIKLLSAKDEKTGLTFNPEIFNDDSSYQVMFGPDKCGSMNKVHFIIRRKNPFTGKYEEKHLNNPPMSKSTKLSVLYTLIIEPNQDFQIRINGEVAKAGNLLNPKILKPSLDSEEEIDDVNDVKPTDWVELKKIRDPKAIKPEDWDEEQPYQIPDPNAVKPNDWDEEMEEYISDPTAIKPDYWNDEEDGEWIEPEIYNPECEKHGCGIWARPTIKNPLYKGKWKAPLIPNPDYKGEWEPRKIPNPDYFRDRTPSNLEPIGGIGFELWTMESNILFDNIYLGHSTKDAEFIGNKTFLPKLRLEEEDAKITAPKPNIEPDLPPTDGQEKEDEPFFDILKLVFKEFIEDLRAYYVKFQIDPIETVTNDPISGITYASLALGTFTFTFGIVSAISFLIGNGFQRISEQTPPTRTTRIASKEGTSTGSSSTGSTKVSKRRVM